MRPKREAKQQDAVPSTRLLVESVLRDKLLWCYLSALIKILFQDFLWMPELA